MRLLLSPAAAAAVATMPRLAPKSEIGVSIGEIGISAASHLFFAVGRSRRSNDGRSSLRTRAEPARKLPAADAAADVAVFRFTLGIPGLDDAQVPRIIGALALAGLAANRIFGGGGEALGIVVPPSQGRAELVAAMLASAAVALPTIEEYIADAEPGRGRGAVAALPGSAQAFRVAAARGAEGGGGGGERGREGEGDAAAAAAAELAWSSYALLRNANCCTVVVLSVEEGKEAAAGTTTTRALVVRGALPPWVARAADPLSAAAAAFSESDLFAAVAEKGEALYVSDARSMSSSSGGDSEGSSGGPWGVLPAGAGCALAQPIFFSSAAAAPDESGKSKQQLVGLLLLAGDRPRALSVRDRAWARAVAKKLAPVVVGRSC